MRAGYLEIKAILASDDVCSYKTFLASTDQIQCIDTEQSQDQAHARLMGKKPQACTYVVYVFRTDMRAKIVKGNLFVPQRELWREAVEQADTCTSVLGLKILSDEGRKRTSTTDEHRVLTPSLPRFPVFPSVMTADTGFVRASTRLAT